DDSGGAERDDGELQGIGMLPAMPGLIMRWIRQAAVGGRALPVRLAFKLLAMADRAVCSVDFPPAGYSRVWPWVGGKKDPDPGQNAQQRSPADQKITPHASTANSVIMPVA